MARVVPDADVVKELGKYIDSRGGCCTVRSLLCFASVSGLRGVTHEWLQARLVIKDASVRNLPVKRELPWADIMETARESEALQIACSNAWQWNV